MSRFLRRQEGGSGGSATPPAPAPAPAATPPPPQPPAPAPAPQGAPAPAPQPDQQQPAPGTPPATPPPAQGDTVPAADYNALRARLQAMETAQATADEARLREQGKHQELAEKAQRERDEARQQVTAVARRAAFVAAISGLGAVDPMAAYNLANAAGMLNDLAVDKDGNVDEKAAKTKATETLEAWKFLKGGQQPFGQGHSGQQPQPAPGTGGKGLTTNEKYRQGFSDPRWGLDQASGGRRQGGG